MVSMERTTNHVRDIIAKEGELVFLAPTNNGFSVAIVSDETFVTSGSKHAKFKLGLFAYVPHSGRYAILHRAIQRLSNQSLCVLKGKSTTQKLNLHKFPHPTSLSSTIKSIMGSSQQSIHIKNRLSQMAEVQASLDECLIIVKKTKGMAHATLKIDELLTAHGMISIDEGWSQFRKQANTPHTLLDLMCLLSEYACKHADPPKRIPLMCDAGKIALRRGDLENRPAWINWQKTRLVDKYSCLLEGNQ
jgi:hypothetical protein